ncbi:HAD hydrolase-like protein [candidate division KSB1 bacterium]|nr:HAD hydrolase-like protein [candidate division KSB1 bacterium]MBL7095978.1 HAD hydrolase-like protein [candidate division KSB1 bacterium]
MYNLNGTDIRIYKNNFEKGNIKHAIFDFDGTISILREGWEKIMEPVMVESICGDQKATPEIIERVKNFIDETTGVQTILQMEGLVEIVKEIGLVPEEKILDAWGYKKIYNDRLMVPVRERISELESGVKSLDDSTLKGSLDFCRKLFERGVTMYLASGTDRVDVRNESEKVTAAQYFKGGIYGAIGTIEEYSKDKVIKEILRNHNLHGSELIVFGDGPVEIRNAKENGAIAVGVASDEVKGHGWNEAKIDRLTKANCDILIPDFNEGDKLLNYLFGS